MNTKKKKKCFLCNREGKHKKESHKDSLMENTLEKQEIMVCDFCFALLEKISSK